MAHLGIKSALDRRKSFSHKKRRNIENRIVKDVSMLQVNEDSLKFGQ